MQATSVEGFCNLLARSRLLTADQVRAARQRWLSSAGIGAADLVAFSRWLVACRLVTDYQAGALLRGHADRLFLKDYKLLDRIGAGNMAGVYKAVHRLGSVVAIKVLPPSRVRDAEAMGRFQREARLALRLCHANVVRTFAVDEDTGLHFLVMEYLDGETLAEVLQRRGRLLPAEAVFVLHQALQGLHYLHEQGVIHRDLKPSNLMILPGDDVLPCRDLLLCDVKILDVGLGRALFDAGSGGMIDLTAPGAILGDANYMAPEQASNAHAADVRSDIYSLGCVLYHALAGQPPFPDSNLARKLVRHAREMPAPIRTFQPIPDELQHVLDRMLAKDPALRYATPQAVALELNQLLVGRTAPIAHPIGPRAEAFQQWRQAQGPPRVDPPSPPPTPLPSEQAPQTEPVAGGSFSSHRLFWVALVVSVILAILFGMFLARPKQAPSTETAPPARSSLGRILVVSVDNL